MNREQLQKDLQQLESDLAKRKEDWARAGHEITLIEGAVGYIRGKLKAMDEADHDIMQRAEREIEGDGELPV